MNKNMFKSDNDDDNLKCEDKSDHDYDEASKEI